MIFSRKGNSRRTCRAQKLDPGSFSLAGRDGTLSSVLLHRGNGHRLIAIDIREQPLQVGDLRQIVENDIRIGGIANEEVLMIGLRREETLQGIDPGNDRATEYSCLIELGDVGL